jgi:hypothetical protein
MMALALAVLPTRAIAKAKVCKRMSGFKEKRGF